MTLPPGARWAGDQQPNPHLLRLVWWRYYGQTTVYAGRFHTPVVYCDTEDTADAVIEQHSTERERGAA